MSLRDASKQAKNESTLFDRNKNKNSMNLSKFKYKSSKSLLEFEDC